MVNITEYKNLKPLVLIFLALCLFLQLHIMWKKPPQEAEAWFSDIAYNLNPQFNGRMGCDLPWGILWSNGIGKTFFYAHHIIYKIFGVGPFQARLLNLLAVSALLALFFRWTSEFYKRQTALAATLLLAASPSLWGFISNGRQDILHCLFSFVTFFFITKAITGRNRLYFMLSGLTAFYSMEVDFRGVEIILCSLLFLLSMRKKITGIEGIVFFSMGAAAAIFVWTYLNVVGPGPANFIQYNIMPSLTETKEYTLASLFNEPVRFLRYINFGAFAAKIEMLYIVFLLAVFFKYRQRGRDADKFIFYWLALTFLTMSLVEKRTYPSYFLMYSPYLCILAGAGVEKLLHKRRAFGLLVLIAAVCLLAQIARSGKYFYHEYIRKDYSPSHFAQRLRESIGPGKVIIGNVTDWYIFKDDRYYGGDFYLMHLQHLFRKPPLSSEVSAEKDRARAILDFLKRKNIEYIIDCNDLKFFIGEYFPGHVLPGKNFALVASIDDFFLGGGAQDSAPLRTEVYKIVSYEP